MINTVLSTIPIKERFMITYFSLNIIICVATLLQNIPIMIIFKVSQIIYAVKMRRLLLIF